jgi:hypothetical protein
MQTTIGRTYGFIFSFYLLVPALASQTPVLITMV